MNENAARLEKLTKMLEKTLAHPLSHGGVVHIIYLGNGTKGEWGKRWIRAIVNRNGTAVRYRYMTWEKRWESAGDKTRPMSALRMGCYTPWNGEIVDYMDWRGENKIVLHFLESEVTTQ